MNSTFLHKYAKNNQMYFYFTWYCQICARNKYASHTGYLSLICQIHAMHIWGMFPHIYATYEVTGSNMEHRAHVMSLVSNIITVMSFGYYGLLSAYLQLCIKYENLMCTPLHLHICIYTGGTIKAWPVHARRHLIDQQTW